jgi:cobalt-zinc-cadmium efflux system outer membrane protein
MRATIVMVLLAVPAGVWAQSVPLNESQALARLSDESPRVRAARAAVDVARADVVAAARWPNPRVTFNHEAVSGVGETYAMVSQPLPLSGRRRLEVAAASARVGAASSHAEDRIRRLRADLRIAFANLVAAQSRERELRRSRDRLGELADVLGRREMAGEAAGFDRLRAQREVIDVEADRGAAATDALRASGVLASFFAAPLGGAVVEATPTERSPLMLPSLQELIARAEAVRADWIALQRERDAAVFMSQSADRRRIPEPEVMAGTKSSSAGNGDVGTIVGVQVNLPLFDRGRPERILAQARIADIDARTDALRLTLRTEIELWRAAVVERRMIAERYRSAMNESADEIERIAQVSYDSGEGSILELLDAYRIGSAARLKQTMLDAAVREAEVELEFVSGWEIP